MIATVIGIKPIKPSPAAMWLITLAVEQDFLDGHPEDTVVVRSRESGDPATVFSDYIFPHNIHAKMGDRCLVLGERKAGVVVPNIRWSQRVPSVGLDTEVLKNLHTLRASRKMKH